MNFRFDQPAWLLLAIIAVPMGVLALRWFGAMSRPRRWSAAMLRLSLLSLLAAMLAGLTLVRPSDQMAVIAVVDTSGSVTQFFKPGVDAEGRALTVNEAVSGFLTVAGRSRRPDDRVGVVTFDHRATAVQSPSRGTRFDVPPSMSTPAQDTGTNIDAAVRLAAAMIPSDAIGRIVVFSDGVATAGNASRAAEAIAGGGSEARSGGAETPAQSSPRRVAIDVVPLEYAVTTEVIVESVDSPPTAPALSSVPVRVVLSSAGEALGTLQVLHEGEPADINGDEPGNGLRLRLSPGRNVQQVVVPLGPGRVHRFEAVWEPDPVGSDPARGVQDTILTNNRAASFTVAPGRGSVLLVDGVSGGDPGGPGAILANTLRSAQIDVQAVSADAVQPDLLWLQAFDLVILQNIAADALPRRTQEALVAYVTQLGGGLIMVGGPDSFGPGGWKGTDLEPILPVKLDLPERLVTPAAAVVIIIDNSGSMNRSVMGSDRSQQEIANEGAAIAIESMDKADLVGVISFNNAYTIEVPLSPNRDPRASAAKVRSIAPDGGTFLPPALEEAHRQLRNATADVKHVIVLSDGVSQGTEDLPALVERMAKDKISVSTIAVGDGADATVMSRMASLGNGRFYRVIDANLLPRIFLKAVRVVRSPMIRETPFTPVLQPSGSPVMEGVDAATMPPLGGLVITQRRVEPTVINTMFTPTGEPVLAYWNAGLGRVAAFTSDAHKWGADWLTWHGHARLWAQLARAIARPPTDRTQTLTADLEGDRLRIRLDATRDDGKPLDLLHVPGSVYAPDGSRTDIRLSQIGPGQYETIAPAPASGTYVITLTPRQGDRMLAPIVGGISRPTGTEFRRLTSDAAALRGLAQMTGGQALTLARPNDADLFDRRNARPAEARTQLWQLLAIWAIVVMLLDVATRRIAWDRLLSREFGADLQRQAAAAVRERGAQAQEAVGRLRRHEQAAATSPGANAPSSALGDEDALRIVREQAARRRQVRDAAKATAGQSDPLDREAAHGGAGASSTSEDQTAAPGEPKPTESVPTEESGLLAAKRRARRQIEDEGNPHG